MKDNQKYVFVLSAITGVTNLLEKFTKTKDTNLVDEIIFNNNKLVKELNISNPSYFETITQTFIRDCKNYLNTHDDIYFQSKIIGYGEVLSTHILYDYLINKGFSDMVKLLNSYHFIKSKKETFKLYPLGEFYGDFKSFNNYTDISSNVYITQGFIASSPSENTILLGRGGSDTTGALISNMLNSKEYIVYTDVNGIYTTDPRICKSANIIKEIDYNIVQELSAMGAKVMHPSSILPCMAKNIPIKIVNTFNDDYQSNFTIIKKVNSSSNKISAIALQKDVKLIKITSESMWNNYGFVYDIFRRFSERRIDVNIISTSQFTISTTTEEKNKILIKDLIQDLEEKYTVELLENCSIVSIVTNYIPEIYKKINFTDIKHHLLSIGATNNSISFVINEEDSENTINKLHDYLI